MTDLASDPGPLACARTLLPRADFSRAVVRHGEFHDVVLIPGTAVVKTARGEAAIELPRRAALHAALAAVGLPFAVPRPLTDVRQVGDRKAVALSWLDGEPGARGGAVEPAELRRVLDALAAVDLAPLEGLLDVPFAYSGRQDWPRLMLDEVVPRLPEPLRPEATARVRAAQELEPVPPRLVHGDLAGDNVLWRDGRVVGVIDWDLAQPFDPALDAACLGWFGWDALCTAVDEQTWRRARVWFGTFALEHLGAAIAGGLGEDEVRERAVRVAGLLER